MMRAKQAGERAGPGLLKRATNPSPPIVASSAASTIFSLNARGKSINASQGSQGKKRKGVSSSNFEDDAAGTGRGDGGATYNPLHSDPNLVDGHGRAKSTISGKGSAWAV